MAKEKKIGVSISERKTKNKMISLYARVIYDLKSTSFSLPYSFDEDQKDDIITTIEYEKDRIVKSIKLILNNDSQFSIIGFNDFYSRTYYSSLLHYEFKIMPEFRSHIGDILTYNEYTKIFTAHKGFMNIKNKPELIFFINYCSDFLNKNLIKSFSSEAKIQIHILSLLHHYLQDSDPSPHRYFDWYLDQEILESFTNFIVNNKEKVVDKYDLPEAFHNHDINSLVENFIDKYFSPVTYQSNKTLMIKSKAI